MIRFIILHVSGREVSWRKGWGKAGWRERPGCSLSCRAGGRVGRSGRVDGEVDLHIQAGCQNGYGLSGWVGMREGM